ncbi:TetR/AcrR family transcriptional regulator [Streptomyces cacaoi]|uniref:TetR/AcrR family transcriptional regulator n=1 Tax=Streptomyces cacaoi TaxID=1898 RepID=UPI0026080D4B|nr:TetR family transcriptional regulator [Streptomyces cacaoi]
MQEERARSSRGAARRAALLEAAAGVVADHGSGSLTHRAVAARAQVSLASVTYHFSSIEDLRRSMFAHAGRVVGMEITASFATGAPGLADLPVMAGDFAVALLTRRREATAAVLEMTVAAAHDPALRETFRYFHERLGELLAPSVGGAEAGLAAASALIGLVLCAVPRAELDTEDFRRSVERLVRTLAAASAADTAG